MLSSIIHHEGSTSGGHYTVTLFDPATKRMWYCDDSKVKPTGKVDQTTASILIYRKVEWVFSFLSSSIINSSPYSLVHLFKVSEVCVHVMCVCVCMQQSVVEIGWLQSCFLGESAVTYSPSSRDHCNNVLGSHWHIRIYLIIFNSPLLQVPSYWRAQL